MVRTSWSEYKEAKLSFLAATAVTETAFGIMRRTDAALVQTYPGFAQFLNRLDSLDLDVGMFDDQTARVYRKDSMLALRSDSDYSEYFCPAAVLCLRDFLNVWEGCREEEPLSQEPQTKTEPTTKVPVALPSAMEEHQRYQEGLDELIACYPYHAFPAVLIMCAKQVHILLKHKVEDLRGKLDEFLVGLVDMMQKEEYCMWLVVALQTYMDIFDVIDHNKEIGIEKLDQAVRHAQHVLNSNLPFRKAAPELCTWSRHRAEFYRSQLCVGEKVIAHAVDKSYDTESISIEQRALSVDLRWKPGVYRHLFLTSSVQLFKFEEAMLFARVGLAKDP